ncbi:MAG: hypothetical protein LKI53_01685 [Bacteroidales bacterium]|jgi:hypothetical protein|nr:hypothetical protein [Bacteroidales bacterium]
MKNKSLYLFLAAVLTVSSCGTANKASSGGFTNGIYYSGESNRTGYDKKSGHDLYSLKNETNTAIKNKKDLSYYISSDVDTVHVGDTNRVDIEYRPNTTYAIVDDEDSYAARLRKFDSPSFNINVTFEDPWDYAWYNPWWGSGWYRPAWITWGDAWYNPWWGTYFTWWGPSYYWGGTPYWGMGWNSMYGWYGSFGPYWGMYDPYYYYWDGPYYHGSWPYRYGRDRYYGQRNRSMGYTNHVHSGNSGYRGVRTTGNTGSYTRRAPDIYRVRGRNVSRSSGSGNSGTSYRRVYGGNNVTKGAVFSNSASSRGSYKRGSEGNSTFRNSGSHGIMYRRTTYKNNNEGRSVSGRNGSGSSPYTRIIRSGNGNRVISTSSGNERKSSGNTYRRTTSSEVRRVINNTARSISNSGLGRTSGGSSGSSHSGGSHSGGSSTRRR